MAVNLIIAWFLAWQAQTGGPIMPVPFPSNRSIESIRDQYSPIALSVWWSRQARGEVNSPELHFSRSWTYAEVEGVAGGARSTVAGPEQFDVLQVVEVGWPFRCLTGQRLLSDVSLRPKAGGPWQVYRMRVLPIWPRWRGLFWNLVVFAGIPFVVIEVPLMLNDLERARRAAAERRRGCCPICAYDLRGEFDKGCSECGWGRTA